ncbi:hypothetical protein SAY86_026040 [Trapa natans]|uniref:Protein SMG7 n=1 Tax=Trapa natans TaxID=22666 RepID=A0AAN7KL13_TRANT|nr:hypothetical protein SAY86_026040 [Trapa natans]
MVIQMDKMVAPSRELAQRLYEKNIELESRRRKSAQARIPPDPNIWQQMRENYETIILEDHAFSEQHNIQHALWQLHYKKIEELRAHYGSAQASVHDGKGPSRPDRITKIRLQFKTFLSEATGFYHDLIMKIRAKYGLPLGHFSDDSEDRIAMEKEAKRSSEMKKGLISCHRCLIYLGDLARYKGLYGEANSKAREYTAASSYYLQAASIWPSIGNPHHQLAILASYSGDDYLTVYRYFRSLAVENPCATARDNLIVAFEKNRQTFTQLPGGIKASVVQFSGKRRGREVKLAPKENDTEAGTLKDKTSTTHSPLKSFCIRFVRLNGILFTKTSLETFSEVLSLVNNCLNELLCSGQEEELKFGADTRESRLFFIRLVAILIFTVNNSKRENEGQTYAEIVQRAVLLQNAFSAAFEIMELLLEKCERLHDPSSSYLFPGILVFVEWLACCPDIASGSNEDEKQAACRSKFFAQFVSFANKLLSSGLISAEDDAEETCFENMCRYEEGETGNRLALLEDYELRGFSPLLPAHTILDFSRKHSFGSDDMKERSFRVKRILAAGKSLLGVVKIDQKTVHYDSKSKQFVVGVVPHQSSDDLDVPLNSVMAAASAVLLENEQGKSLNSGASSPNSHLQLDVDEEDEVIVFRPTLAEKQADINTSSLLPCNGIGSHGHMPLQGTFISDPFDNVRRQAASHAFLAENPPIHNTITVSQNLQPIQVTSNWLQGEHTSLVNSLKDLRLLENGQMMRAEGQSGVSIHPSQLLDPIPQPGSVSSTDIFYCRTRTPEHGLQTSNVAAVSTLGVNAESLSVNLSQPLGLKKNPVSRPVRHVGPPPGFGPVPKQVNGPVSALEITPGNPMNDDYSWLDGYQMPSNLKSYGLGNSTAIPSHTSSHHLSGSTGFSGAVGFPFPGKQVPITQFQMEKDKAYQNYSNLDHVKQQYEQRMLQSRKMLNENLEIAPLTEQYQEGSGWTGGYVV